MAEEQPRCVHCRHYFVTYQPHHPHACRYFGIRTPGPPSIAVLRSSGESCRAFEKRVPGVSRDIRASER